MKPPPNEVDKFGFPLPSKFEDDPKLKQPLGRSIRQRGRAVLILLLVILLGSLLMESGIKQNGWGLWADFCASKAENSYHSGDLAGAISWLDWAISAAPDAPRLYIQRGKYRMKAKDLQGSLADFSKVVELKPKSSGAYMDRSLVHQRLGQATEALNDLDSAVKYKTAGDPGPLNARAYGRALAGVELKGALEDVQKALEFSSPANPAYCYYLDTRGFVYHLLGDQDKALKDLDKAIDLGEKAKDDELARFKKMRAPESILAIVTKELNEVLAVIHHHRGLVHEKLGHADKASADLKQGEEWGYNPAEGIF